MNQSYIECRSVSKTYFCKHHEINALTNVNINIDKGQFVIISGRSGAGKSTLLNLIGGLIRPTSGTIRIENTIISEAANDDISKLLSSRTGIIFQSFNLLPAYTVYENIEIALVPSGLNAAGIKKIIMPMAEQFGIINKLDLLPEELSVGQQQKVAIIRTLVKNPSLILADEPTGSVDEETATEILSYLSSLNKEKQATVLLATHGLTTGKAVDRIIKIKDGYVEEV
ncbi:MAG TPA: ABC transporter ATP-binding protein [Bacteroidales bacterium]|nr:ABC transporter ATP-binding protein [Bacteroidales bacterium]